MHFNTLIIVYKCKSSLSYLHSCSHSHLIWVLRLLNNWWSSQIRVERVFIIVDYWTSSCILIITSVLIDRTSSSTWMIMVVLIDFWIVKMLTRCCSLKELGSIVPCLFNQIKVQQTQYKCRSIQAWNYVFLGYREFREKSFLISGYKDETWVVTLEDDRSCKHNDLAENKEYSVKSLLFSTRPGSFDIPMIFVSVK